ncbi:ABC transporter ATP-binding protein [Halorarius halobius]|uniref:ABC transporter ATP-binding protein n=1 Tax=Halorarius halobius TaxID=2962671 RepID=UPI0020CF00B3|nr:ABC transporter ATP-binding protein [Halorarius halobius]
MISFDVAATFSDGDTRFEVDAALDVAEGETLVVLGPSGSGKTLLLETVAGHHAHAGSVTVDGESVTARPPEERGFGFVFQDYALFPHMDARENVAFGQRYGDRPVEPPADERDDWTPPETEGGEAVDPLPNPDDLLDRMGVADLAERSPPTLSGGEKQRVALARALAIDPRVLLLDEPLSALDVPTRQALRDDLADVLADVTAVHVTHNRTTARALADRVAVMRNGEVVQVGTPEAVFEAPDTPEVAAFVGANVLPGRLVDGGAGQVAVRPEHVRRGGPHEATVERVVREDATYRVTLALDGASAVAFWSDPPAEGETVGVGFPADRAARLDGG